MPQPMFSSFPEGTPSDARDVEVAYLALLLRGAEVRVNAEADEEERGSFFLAAGKYFQASWGEMEWIRSSGIPVDEIAVALHVSRYAGVSSKDVAEARLAGMSWTDILFLYSLHPATLCVPLEPQEGEGAPLRISRCHGVAAHEAWRSRVNSDDDVVNLMNLKFIVEHYGIAPEKIIALRSAGWSFATIHAEVRRPELARVGTRQTRPACG